MLVAARADIASFDDHVLTWEFLCLSPDVIHKPTPKFQPDPWNLILGWSGLVA